MLRDSHQVSEELEHAINDPNADMPMMAFIPAHMLAADDDAHAALKSHSNKRDARTAAERTAARDRWHRVYAEARRVLIARNVIRPLVRNHSAVDSIHASLQVAKRSADVLVLPDPHARLTARERAWSTLNDPGFSAPAKYWSIFILLAIVFSCVAFVVQSMPQHETSTHTFWDTQEMVCIIIFTVEFVARLCVCPSLSLFVFNFLNIVDAISIIPWYIEKALFSNLSLNSAVFRSLRLIRVFRLLKVSRYLTFMNSLAEAMLQSIQPLYILLFIILIGLLIFSSAIFYAERGVRQSGTSADQFGSIIQSMWWCVATITTVGYGDLVPTSDFGKLIAVACSFFGILVISVPISVVTMNFHQVFERMRAIRSVNFTETNLLSAALKQSYHAMAQKEDEALAAAASAAAPAAMKGLYSNSESHATADDESPHSTHVHVGEALEMTPTQHHSSPSTVNAAGPSSGNGGTVGTDGSSGKASATIVAPHELDAAGVQQLSIEDMRQHMFVDIEMQINLVLQRNQEWLMENINIMVARRRVIVRHQIEMILKQVPIFYRNVNRFHEPPTEANTGDGMNDGGVEQGDERSLKDAGHDVSGMGGDGKRGLAAAQQNSTEDESDGELGEPIEPSAGEIRSSETSDTVRPLCLEDDSALFPELSGNPLFRVSTISAVSAAPPLPSSSISMPPPAPTLVPAPIATKTVSAAAALSHSSAPESAFASNAKSASSASACESPAPGLPPLRPLLPSLPAALAALPSPTLINSSVFASSSSLPCATIALGTSDSMPSSPAPLSPTLPPSSSLSLAAFPSAAASSTSTSANRAQAKAEARVAAAAARGHGALLLRALSSPKR